jgi:CRP/FNR family transcriptional regulator
MFQKLMSSNVYVENFSYRSTIDRFSDVMWTMEQILFMSFDQRLSVFLLDESVKTQSDTIKLTHAQIAKYMGSAREVVSRMLKRFEADGLVQLTRGGIVLLDKKRLRM